MNAVIVLFKRLGSRFPWRQKRARFGQPKIRTWTNNKGRFHACVSAGRNYLLTNPSLSTDFRRFSTRFRAYMENGPYDWFNLSVKNYAYWNAFYIWVIIYLDFLKENTIYFSWILDINGTLWWVKTFCSSFCFSWPSYAQRGARTRWNGSHFKQESRS